MKTSARVGLVAVLGLAVALAVALRQPDAGPAAVSPVPAALPRLLDVGADTCIPCRAMVPVLAELRRDYAGRLQVDFIDAWKEPERAAVHNVYGIPVQIFFDPSGRELYRHVGFFSKADILAAWKKLGYDFTSGTKG